MKVLNETVDLTPKRHKHADLIIAWANGAQIQFKSGSGNWVDCMSLVIGWYEEVEYRIKREKLQYRVALLKRDDKVWTSVTSEPLVAKSFEELDTFSRWLTDWVEYEI